MKITEDMAKEVLELLYVGTSMAGVEMLLGISYYHIRKIKEGTYFKNLAQGELPIMGPNKVPDEWVIEARNKFAAGVSREYIFCTCPVAITKRTLYNILFGHTHSHLPVPDYPKVVRAECAVPKVDGRVGARNKNARLTELEVMALMVYVEKGIVPPLHELKIIAEEYDVSYSAIKAVLTGRTWRHITGLKRPFRS